MLEGVQGGSPADIRAAGADPTTFAAVSGLHVLTRLLGAAAPAPPNAELVERIAPRPLLLVSAGEGLEARVNEAYATHGGTTTELWNLPRAEHAAAVRTSPAEYVAACRASSVEHCSSTSLGPDRAARLQCHSGTSAYMRMPKRRDHSLPGRNPRTSRTTSKRPVPINLSCSTGVL